MDVSYCPTEDHWTIYYNDCAGHVSGIRHDRSRRTATRTTTYVRYQRNCAELNSIVPPRPSLVSQMGVGAICDIDFGHRLTGWLFHIGPLLFTLCCNFGEGHGVLRRTAQPVRRLHLRLHLRQQRGAHHDNTYHWALRRHTTALLLTYRSRRSFSSVSQRLVTSRTSPSSTSRALPERCLRSWFIKSLGVTLDLHLTLVDDVTTMSKACYFHTRALRHTRTSIPDNVANMVACSIVGSRLDHCNSLLASMSEANIAYLQCVQNTKIARVLTGIRRYMTELSRKLFTSRLF